MLTEYFDLKDKVIIVTGVKGIGGEVVVCPKKRLKYTVLAEVLIKKL